jgi:hypothetical protein
MININRYTLSNGLRVIHNEDNTTQMVALNLLYDVGARDEDPDHTGFAHLFEHLMFGGSVHVPDYDTPVQNAGGENNAWTNNDITNYYITLPRQNVETGFWLESDRMLSLDFNPRIRTGIDGDLNKLKLTTLTAELPGALGLFARGELTHLTDSLLRGGDITLEAETKDLKFVSTLAEGIEIPYGTRLEGKFTMAGTKMGTDLLLMQPEAQAVVAADTIPITVYNDSISVADDFKMERAARLFAKYDLSRDRYEADLAVNHFDLHQFMPADSLYTLSTRLKVEGEGFDFFSPRTYFNAEGGIDRFHYGSYHLTGISLAAGLEKSKVHASLAVKNWTMDIKAHLDGILKPHDVLGDLKMDVAHLDWQALHLMDTRFQTSQHLGVRFSSDLRKRYAVEAEMTNATIVTAKRTSHSKDLFAGFRQRDKSVSFNKTLLTMAVSGSSATP